MNTQERQTIEAQLLKRIKDRLAELETLLEVSTSHWVYEDLIYRFYHRSFKVYQLQQQTQLIVEMLRSLAPDQQTLCSAFLEILTDGAAGKTFSLDHNKNWTLHTRPFIEAFFHARFFLEMAVYYGNELEEIPEVLPSGWAALLCLYNMR